MREVLSLHIGQAGAQIGSSCWELYCMGKYELHPRIRPRKNLKIDFLPENPIEWCPFWYHSYGFFNLSIMKHVLSLT